MLSGGGCRADCEVLWWVVEASSSAGMDPDPAAAEAWSSTREKCVEVRWMVVMCEVVVVSVGLSLYCAL